MLRQISLIFSAVIITAISFSKLSVLLSKTEESSSNAKIAKSADDKRDTAAIERFAVSKTLTSNSNAEEKIQLNPTEIDKIEAKLREIKAIEGLNQNSFSATERAQIGEWFKKLDQMRINNLEEELRDIEKEVAELEIKNAVKLRSYNERRVQ